jgi:hypothetical protein
MERTGGEQTAAGAFGSLAALFGRGTRADDDGDPGGAAAGRAGLVRDEAATRAREQG